MHQELAGEAAIYNLLVSVRLHGQLRLPALQRSLHALERLHPALRTTFTFDGDKLIAIEHEPAGRPLAVRTSDLAQAIRDAGARALELPDQPPWTYELLQTGPGHAVLLLVFHHIAVDGVSIYRLLTELARGYSAQAGLGAAMASGSPESGPPESGPSGIAHRQDPEFWARLMKDAPAPAHLPGQQAPGDIADFSGWCQQVELPGIRAADLRLMAAARGVTLHTLVLSAFLRTIAGATGTSDVVIGMPLSRRGLDVSFSAVGQFASVLPVRFRLPGDLSPDGCLDVVGQTMLAAQRHCVADPEAILEAVRAQQGRFTGDPFRVVFAWEDDLPAPEFAGLEASWSLEFGGWSASELTVELAPHEDVIAGRVIGRLDSSAEVDVGGFMRALAKDLAAELTRQQAR